ncbi:MAG TPA: septation protein SepH [Jatrophihabitantaceae bacterium]|nr:septation protein SepH [Jatrophihabitantaceae bacterium]
MRQLRYLRPGDDGNHVVLETADGAEQFSLHVTVPLRDAIRVDLPRLTQSQSEPEAEPSITPREIQIRVRAGAHPEDLAQENGMALERVLRFAGPVIDERARVANEARRARARRSTTEGQTVIFGEAVDQRFSAHGIDPFTVTWDAYRRLDGQWVVTATWTGGEDKHTAEWAFNLTGRSVAPIDDTSAELLSDRPVRPLAPVADEPVRPTLAAAPPLVPGVVAFPVLSEVPPPAEKVEDVFDQDALETLDDDPRHVQVAAAELDADDHAAPPLPLRLADKPTGSADASAESVDDDAREPTKPLPRLKNLGVASRDENAPAATPRKNPQRPHVPAWDDIMLGVRRTTD